MGYTDVAGNGLEGGKTPRRNTEGGGTVLLTVVESEYAPSLLLRCAAATEDGDASLRGVLNPAARGLPRVLPTLRTEQSLGMEKPEDREIGSSGRKASWRTRTARKGTKCNVSQIFVLKDGRKRCEDVQRDACGSPLKGREKLCPEIPGCSSR